MRTPKEIGNVIRRLRGDMSLRTFAEKCNISHTTLDNIEKGKDFRTGKPTNPSAATLQKIADAAGVDLGYLLNDCQINTTVNQRFIVVGPDGERLDSVTKNTPEEPELSEGEKALISLFRAMPREAQPMAVEMIRAALKAQGLLK